MRLFIIFFLLVVTAVQAENIKSIRIGTYTNKVLAEQSLKKLQHYVQKNRVITQLQKEYEFVFKARRSGKYYITLAEPFSDKKVLMQVFNNLRSAYPDIYIAKGKANKKLAVVKKSPVKKSTITKEDHNLSKSISLKSKEKNATVASPTIILKEKIPILPPKTTFTHEEKQKTAPKEEKKSGYEVGAPLTLLTGFVVFLIIMIIILFARGQRYKRRFELESMQKKVLQNESEDLKRKLQNKDKVFAHTSHELRNPMGAIIGLSQLLLDEKISMKQKEYVKKIEGSATYLLEVVNDILDISKIEAGALKIEQREFNLNHVLRHVINIISVKARENGTQIELDVDNQLSPYVVGDSLRLTQILINLLSNAVKFTKNGVVKLGIRKIIELENSVTVEFIVKDSGIGMSSNQLKNIFLSYVQASSSTAREFGGTGLGLSIVKYLVDLLGGDIDVKSVKNQGTTFTLHLKFAIQRGGKRFYRLPGKEYLNKNVLLIENTPSNREKLKDAFEYFNYSVSNIATLDETYELSNRIDIIIVNKKLLDPKMIDRLKKIKNQNKKIKLVLFSDEVLEIDKELSDQLQADEFLSRPFTQDDILSIIKNLWNSKKIVKIKELSPKDQLKTLRDKRLLIADDNILNHKVLKGLFGETSFELVFVEDGQEAVDTIVRRQDKFDLILLDINMPKLDGFEVAKKIREMKKYDDVPILALTADLMQNTIEKTYEIGMQGHLSKPIIVNNLYERVYKLLNEENTIYSILKKNKKYHEFSPAIGLREVNDDQILYKKYLKEFKEKYFYSADKLKEMLQSNKFKEAREIAIAIKEDATYIGAYKVYEHADEMQYVFEKGKRGNFLEVLSYYDDSLELLLKEIEKYLKE